MSLLVLRVSGCLQEEQSDVANFYRENRSSSFNKACCRYFFSVMMTAPRSAWFATLPLRRDSTLMPPGYVASFVRPPSVEDTFMFLPHVCETSLGQIRVAFSVILVVDTSCCPGMSLKMCLVGE